MTNNDGDGTAHEASIVVASTIWVAFLGYIEQQFTTAFKSSLRDIIQHARGLAAAGEAEGAEKLQQAQQLTGTHDLLTSAVEDARKALFLEQQNVRFERGKREAAEAKAATMEQQMEAMTAEQERFRESMVDLLQLPVKVD